MLNKVNTYGVRQLQWLLEKVIILQCFKQTRSSILNRQQQYVTCDLGQQCTLHNGGLPRMIELLFLCFLHTDLQSSSYLSITANQKESL